MTLNDDADSVDRTDDGEFQTEENDVTVSVEGVAKGDARRETAASTIAAIATAAVSQPSHGEGDDDNSDGDDDDADDDDTQQLVHKAKGAAGSVEAREQSTEAEADADDEDAPFPLRSIMILALVLLVNSFNIASLFPYVAFMVEDLTGITDRRELGMLHM